MWTIAGGWCPVSEIDYRPAVPRGPEVFKMDHPQTTAYSRAVFLINRSSRPPFYLPGFAVDGVAHRDTRAWATDSDIVVFCSFIQSTVDVKHDSLRVSRAAAGIAPFGRPGEGEDVTIRLYGGKVTSKPCHCERSKAISHARIMGIASSPRSMHRQHDERI
jgi:hypothetical protein